MLERLRRRRHRRNSAAVRGDVDLLVAIFDRQLEVQRAAKTDPTVMVDMEQRIQYLKDMVLAAEDELHEVLGETGWKPWATSRHINLEEARDELVDVVCFVVNLSLALDMTPHELARRHAVKVDTNLARQRDGYTGVK